MTRRACMFFLYINFACVVDGSKTKKKKVGSVMHEKQVCCKLSRTSDVSKDRLEQSWKNVERNIATLSNGWMDDKEVGMLIQRVQAKKKKNITNTLRE